MAEMAPVRDAQTGKLFPGARLPGGGNPLAKAHYAYRKAFIDAATPEEWDAARAKLVEDVLSDNPRIRAAARPMYYELMCGKSAIPVDLGRSDDNTSRNAAEATLGRVLAVLENHPDIKSEVSDALLADLPPIDTIATEVPSNGQSD